MFANFATALPTGAALTFLILFGMQSLIAMQPGAAVETTTSPLPNFVLVPKKEELFKDEFLPEKIPQPTPLPPIIRNTHDPVDDPAINVSQA